MAFLALCALLAFGPQGGAFPPTTENRWARQGVALAIREGVLPEYQYGLFKTRLRDIATRYEFAVYLHAAVTEQTERAETALDGGASDVERASLLRANALLPFYRRGAREFAKELRSLDIKGDWGIDHLATLGRRLQRTSPPRSLPFPDVPPSHWAAKSVGDLRALDLLHGYPDGRFRG